MDWEKNSAVYETPAILLFINFMRRRRCVFIGLLRRKRTDLYAADPQNGRNELSWILKAILMADQNKPMAKGEVTSTRPPLPPFTRETAIQKVRLAEDGWNSRDPDRVSLAYTPNSRWRNRAEFMSGRQEIVAFLTRKWSKELDYRLIKELWAFDGNRVAV
jgi:hypothetical protein